MSPPGRLLMIEVWRQQVLKVLMERKVVDEVEKEEDRKEEGTNMEVEEEQEG